MSRITSEILKRLAPRTAQPKRDRLLPFLNEAMPRYAITTELRVSAFLATTCFESDFFKALAEYGRGKGKKYGTIYFGRGLIQNTWKTAYAAFTKFIKNNSYFAEKPDFIKNPELLEEPLWAVEAACWFWQINNLNSYADKGKFFAIQGLVNRGDAGKRAIDYDRRLALYDKALNVLPDDFSLIPIADSTERSGSRESENAAIEPTETSVEKEPESEKLPALNSDAKQTKVSVTDGDVKVETSEGANEKEKVAVIKKPSRLKTLWAKIVALFTGNSIFDGITEKAAQVQQFGLSASFWSRLFYFAVAATVVYLLYELYRDYQDKKTTETIVRANTTDSNKVILIEAEKADEFKEKGYSIVGT